ELEEGRAGVVREVADGDPDALRELATLGLFPGTRFRLVERSEEGPARVEVGDRTIEVGTALAGAVFVEQA
ncbi:MAG: ferrous iron transport protein A, partial [Gemmatimonadota bacterium]|nr:ferrous iron transport protein A [Gemmatimonadota bacterium]